jgi:S1-C subfamily serine protease
MRFLVIAALTVALAAPFAANAALIEKIKVGNWEGGAYNDDNTKAFLSCTVGTTFVNGTYLNISSYALGGTGIGIFAPTLKLQIGTPISGTLKIDDRYFTTFEGRAIADGGFSVSFPETDSIFEALRRGRLLTVTSSVRTIQYDLTDTARALTALKECVTRYRPFARINTEYAAWLQRNTWFNDPKYAAAKELAIRINSTLLSEGADSFARTFYDELDRRLMAVVEEKNSSNGSAGVMGSGVVVAETGEVLTNFHVIEKCVGPVEIRSSKGVNQTTTVLIEDKANDLALLSSTVRADSLPSIRKSPIRNGEQVAVVGFPLESYDITITEGVISALSALNISTMMTISAPANPGNSGGPVFDLSGSIVGILTSRHPDPDAQNTNYAIKQSAVRDFLARRNINPSGAGSRVKMSFSEIVRNAENFTVRLSCAAEATE